MGKYITLRERYKIETLLEEKRSCSYIAGQLGIKYHTLRKEIKRGTVRPKDTLLNESPVYKADYAQLVYEKSVSNRGRHLKIGADHAFAAYIEHMIKDEKYSPEALLLHMKNHGITFSTTLCYKTIYNYLDMGLFLHISNKDLTSKKDRKKKKKDDAAIAVLNGRGCHSIEERNPAVLKRKQYGHWEMDTVVSAQGKGKSCLLVLSERMTREEIVIKMNDKKASSVVHALNMLERKYGSKKFREKFKTITCDNGCEFLDSKGIEKCSYAKGNRTLLYYCHPYSSWERGTNENINRMIRRFFPKGTNFDEVSKQQVAMAEAWINNYPRRILGGLSSTAYRENLGIA